eukprot:COSAG02_NODE_66026_length_256_cov_0.987261_1_plen_23_part_01
MLWSSYASRTVCKMPTEEESIIA